MKRNRLILFVGVVITLAATLAFLSALELFSGPSPYDHSHQSSDNTIKSRIYGNASDSTPPIAIISGGNHSVDEDSPAILNGSGSTDNIGIVLYQWTFFDGAPITLTGMIQSYSFYTPGIYQIYLTVADAVGNNDTDSIILTVLDVTPPTAIVYYSSNTSINLDVSQGEVVTFNGNRSSDNVGVISYSWVILDNSIVTIGESTFNYTFINAGKFSVILRVTDLAGNSNISMVAINVLDAVMPIPSAGSDMTIDEDTPILFNGTGSSDNVGISIYEWSFFDGIPVTIFGPLQSYTFQTPGTYIVTLTVFDSQGNHATDSLTITVLDITPPTADAGPGIVTIEDVPVVFDASASFDNVGVVQYWWSFIGGFSANVSGVITSHTFVDPGIYCVTLWVADSAGNWDSDSITITIIDTTKPVVVSGSYGKAVPGIQMAFNASQSTDNGIIVSYVWSFTDRLPIMLFGPTPSYAFSTYGLYQITLTVYDSWGNWNSTTFNVQVKDVIPPIAMARPGYSVNLGDFAYFNAGASSDNVGIINYTWTVDDGSIITLYGVMASYEFNNCGPHVVTLNVFDAEGNSGSTSILMEVIDSIPPVATVSNKLTVIQGVDFIFDGSVSTDNVGVVNYTWTFDDGGQVVLYGNSPSYVFKNPGVHNITLTIKDLAGNFDVDGFSMTVEPVWSLLNDIVLWQIIDVVVMLIMSILMANSVRNYPVGQSNKNRDFEHIEFAEKPQ